MCLIEGTSPAQNPTAPTVSAGTAPFSPYPYDRCGNIEIKYMQKTDTRSLVVIVVYKYGAYVA